jgi:outer membrane lipopolysaccharide assembly protein LptE/RlpB
MLRQALKKTFGILLILTFSACDFQVIYKEKVRGVGIKLTNHHDHHKNTFTYIFERVCYDSNIEHRKTKKASLDKLSFRTHEQSSFKEAKMNSLYYASLMTN